MTGNFGNAAVDIDLQARREQQFISLSGDITSAPGARRSRTSEPSLETDFDTLNEPVWDTVKRDLHTIGTKFGHVLVPRDNRELLRNWDLWGPLFICVFISLLLQGGKEGKGLHFTEVFSLTFFGSCVVTLNIKLLGGHISFFQTLCVLGYCLLPPGAAALICKFIEITVAGFVWATHASTAFLTDSQPPKRKVLATYPVFLFYFVVSWMIISHPAL
uniref:Protein YIPF n=1 Tax=Syphacia muris TaxID=451379 RepID=A0A0N5A7K0_9BILA